MAARILVAASADLRAIIGDALELDGFEVLIATTAPLAIELSQSMSPDVILLESSFGEHSGMDLLLNLQQDSPEAGASVIMIADAGRDDVVVAALELGATDYVPKPVSIAVLRARLRNALRVRKLRGRILGQRDQAEKASERKAAFLANMSHEIRTPMTAILGFADVLYADGDIRRAPPHRLEAIRTIQRNSEHLLNLVNDILDLAKIEAGKMDVSRHRCSPLQVFQEVASLLRGAVQQKELLLHFRFAGPIPDSVHTDPQRLRQVLLNLVNNAIKFTEQGSILVVVELLNDQLEEPRLQITVRDSGIGMCSDLQSHLFEPFSQATPATASKYGGTGLGLLISKQLIELLGGEIELSSILGEGSTFVFTISTGSLEGVQLVQYHEADVLRQSIDPQPRVAASIKLDQRVLLVDDGPDNQRLFAFILRAAGAEVVTADNGEIAVQLAITALQEGHPFDCILMDMQMPVLDGYSATRNLRDAGYRLPIVALTANAMAAEKQQCLDAGCDACVTKPIDRYRLLQVVSVFGMRAANSAVELQTSL